MSYEKKQQLHVVIRGVANSGRSALSHIIESALAEYGLGVMVVGEDMKPAALYDQEQRRLRMCALASRKPHIEIHFETVDPGKRHVKECGTAYRGCAPGCTINPPEFKDCGCHDGEACTMKGCPRSGGW